MEYPYLNQSLQLSFVGFSQIISFLIAAQKNIDNKTRYTRLNSHQDLSELAYAPPDQEAYLTSKEFEALVGKSPAEIFQIDALRENFADYLADAATPIQALTNPDLYHLQVVDLRKLPVFQRILSTPKMALTILNQIFGFDKFDRNAAVHPAILNLLSVNVRQELEDYLQAQVPLERAKTIAALDGLYRITHLNMQLLAYSQAELYEHAIIIEPTASLANDWRVKLDATINWAQQTNQDFGVLCLGYRGQDSRSFMSPEYVQRELGINPEQQVMFSFERRDFRNAQTYSAEMYQQWQQMIVQDYHHLGSNFILLQSKLTTGETAGRCTSGYLLNLSALTTLGQSLGATKAAEYDPAKIEQFLEKTPEQRRMINVEKALRFAQAHGEQKGELFAATLNAHTPFLAGWQKLKDDLNWGLMQVYSSSFPLVAVINKNVWGFNRPLLNYSQQIFIYNKTPAMYVSIYQPTQTTAMKEFLTRTPNINWIFKPIANLKDYNLEYREENFEEIYRDLSPETVELTFTTKEIFKKVLANPSVREEDYILITNTHQNLPNEFFQTINKFLTKGQAEPAFRTPLKVTEQVKQQAGKVSGFATTAIATGEHEMRLSRKHRRQLQAQAAVKDTTSLSAKIDLALERYGNAGTRIISQEVSNSALGANGLAYDAKNKATNNSAASSEQSSNLNSSAKAQNGQKEVSLLDLVKQADAQAKAKKQANQPKTEVENHAAKMAFLGTVLEAHAKPFSATKRISGIESNVPLILADGYSNNALFKLVNKSYVLSWHKQRLAYPQTASEQFFSLPSWYHAFSLTRAYTQQEYQIPVGFDGQPAAAVIRLINQTSALSIIEKEQLQHFLMAQKAAGGSTVIQFEQFAFVPDALWQELKQEQQQLIVSAYLAKQKAQIITHGNQTSTVNLNEEDFKALTTTDLADLAAQLGMKHFVTPAAAKVEAYLSQIFETSKRKYGPYPYILIKAPLNNGYENDPIGLMREQAKAQGMRVVAAGQRMCYLAPDQFYALQLLYQAQARYMIRPYLPIGTDHESGAIIEENIEYDHMDAWLDYALLYTNQVMFLQALVTRNLFARSFGLSTEQIDQRLISLMEQHQLRGDEFTFDGYSRFNVIAGLTRPYEAFMLAPMQEDPYPLYLANVKRLETHTQTTLSALNREFQYLLACQQSLVHWSSRPLYPTGFRPARVVSELLANYFMYKLPALQQQNRTLLHKVFAFYQQHQVKRDEVIFLDTVATIPQPRTLMLQNGADTLAFSQIPTTWVISKALIRQAAAIWQEPDWHIGKLLQLVAPNQRIGFVAQSPVKTLPLDKIAERVQVFDQQYQTPSMAHLLSWAGQEKTFALQSISGLGYSQDSYVEHIAQAYSQQQKAHDQVEITTRQNYASQHEQHKQVHELSAANAQVSANGKAQVAGDQVANSSKVAVLQQEKSIADFTAEDFRAMAFKTAAFNSYTPQADSTKDQTDAGFNISQTKLQEDKAKATIQANAKKSKGSWWKFGLFGDDEEDRVAVNTSSQATAPTSQAQDELAQAVQTGASDEVSKMASRMAHQDITANSVTGLQLNPEFENELLERVRPSFTHTSLHESAARLAFRKLYTAGNITINRRKANVVRSNIDFGTKYCPSVDYAQYLQQQDQELAKAHNLSVAQVEQQDMQQLDALVRSAVFAAYPRLEQQAVDVGVVTSNRNTQQTIRQLKVKVINLDSQFDRWEGMLQQFTPSLVHSVQRIDGIQGRHLSDDNIAEHFAQDVFLRHNSRFANINEIGSALAHRKALLSVLYDPSIDVNDFALICEDDIVLSKQWQARINRILQQASNAPIDAINLIHPSFRSESIYPLELHNAKLITLSNWRYQISADLPQLIEYAEFKPLSSACYLVRKSAIVRAVQTGVLDRVGATAADLVHFLNIWPDRVRLAIPTLVHLNHYISTVMRYNNDLQKLNAVYCYNQDLMQW
ncbi:glycosyltransferase family 25 protein [Psittacicella hinzii]|uniref:Glycosyl transferase family 25 domain-containing protein n=1 Tax=Psittacicella hinzii TaxID=2028575 RepID=A0A3A1YJS9_9GAMM|nr:glycosyltransferase family 25 protein [Psittacicella hinzii]RIY38442.1 hypothetical protein CKF58_04275 [Psittacicella hinzii]